ncbi:MAG: 50S ribosomal protein L25 [Planctomycetota bacterium]|nr:50S ribosomal protein L25 [Planctomycetota bacterium]
MEFFQIEVTNREDVGKGPIGRLRRAGNVPGNLYGLGRPNVHLTIPGDELARFFDGPSNLVELRMGDKGRQAIVREVQIDPLTDEILHVDFLRVDEDAEIENLVRLTYKGTAIGTTKGGVFQALEEAIAIRSKPKDLPSELIIEIAGLELGDGVHAGDVELPSGVTLVSAAEMLLAQVTTPKVTAEPTEEEGEGEAPAEGGEAPAAEGGDA